MTSRAVHIKSVWCTLDTHTYLYRIAVRNSEVLLQICDLLQHPEHGSTDDGCKYSLKSTAEPHNTKTQNTQFCVHTWKPNIEEYRRYITVYNICCTSIQVFSHPRYIMPLYTGHPHTKGVHRRWKV